MSIISAILILFFVMDPLGNIPLFITTLKDFSPERRHQIVKRELMISLGIMFVVLFFGQQFLNLMKIDQPSLSVAGGLVLFIIAIRMIFPIPETGFSDNPGGEPFIVPLAVPLIVGPSTMSVVLLMVSREPERIMHWCAAIFVAWVLNSIILLLSFQINRVLGAKAMTAITRLMGMLLTAVSVQMFMEGVKKFLKA